MAQPLRISKRIIVPLCAVLILFGTFTFSGLPKGLSDGGRMFTSFRVAETGEHFLEFRRRTAPMTIYGGLHAAPAIVWSVLIPFQHIDSLRRKWPVLHRTSGYVILSISLLLSMTGYWFFLSKNAYSHANWLHVHNLNGWVTVGWPTFEASTYVLAPFYWVSLYKTAVTARDKDFTRHRKWAVLHTMFASVISLERVGIVILYGVGFATTLFATAAQVHQFLGIPQTLEAIAAAEMDMFALANMIALVLLLSWMAYEFGWASSLAQGSKLQPTVNGRTHSSNGVADKAKKLA